MTGGTYIPFLPRQSTGTTLLVIALGLYSLWQLHLDTEPLTFFQFLSSLKLYYVVATLKEMWRAQLWLEH